MAQLPIEQEYNRFIPPVIDQILEEKTEDDWSSEKAELTENDDGSVTILDTAETPPETKFNANLAEELASVELSRIAADYLELIERDKKAREKRDEQYEEGIRRTGLGNDAPGGASFAGASKVVHPILAEGCVDFAARAIKELCPAKGPVKTQIIGRQYGEKLQKANRKCNFLNYQLTKQCPEFFTEIEQLLSQLPLGGSQYLKVLPNFKQKRPEFEFVPIDKCLVPFSAANFYTAQRVTHIQELTEQMFENRIAEGYYRDVNLYVPELVPEQTKAEKATAKVQGKEDSGYNEDGLRTVYEITCYAKFDFDSVAKGELAPYVVVVDDHLSSVLAIYRNWEEQDQAMQKLDWMVEFKFIPWRGAQGIGLPHLIGGLAAALTGSLRALLDSAHVNNAPTALKLKGARFNGQTQQVDITQIQEIEGAPGVDDIRRLIMPMPFNPPSTVLFQLLDWLTNAAKGVVATAEEKIADAGNNMPVGTALALIEQGSYNYAAIHARLHNSMGRLLGIVCRVNRMVLDEEVTVEELGEDVISLADFDGNTDIVPVSDPNIFSEAQRYAQIQAVMQLAVQGQQQGVMYDMHEIHRRSLELLKVSDIDDLLPNKTKPTEMNAVAENLTAMLGNAIMVFPEQDHISHLETHLRFATDPNFGANPLVAAKTLPPLLEHVSQHLAFLYSMTCEAIAKHALPNGPQNIDVKMMDQFLAAVSAQVTAASQPIFAPIQQLLQQAQQLLSQSIPPPPVDPAAQVQRDIGMAEIERQKAKDQQDAQIRQQELQVKDAHKQVDVQQQQQAVANEHVLKLQQQALDNQHKLLDLRQAEQELKLQAAKLQQDAANEQQKLELERQQQDNQFAIERAQFEQERVQFMIEQQTATLHAQEQAQANAPINDMMKRLDEVAQQIANKPKTVKVVGSRGRVFTLTQGDDGTVQVVRGE